MWHTRTVWAAAVLAHALWVGCAPPPKPDYDAPDASLPDEAPKIIKFSPENGAENVTRRPIIRVSYNRQLNAHTIETYNFSLHSGASGGRWTTSYYDPFKMELVVWSAGYLLRKSTWVFEINKGIEGANGLPAEFGVVTEFRTGDDIIYESPYHLRSYKNDIRPIFEERCASCHGGSDAVAGLKLDTEENIATTAIGQPSQGRPNWDLIVPTQPGSSYLLYKLSDDPDIPGMRMPRSLDEDATALPLSDEEKTALLDWIVTGAVFFDPEAPAN